MRNEETRNEEAKTEEKKDEQAVERVMQRMLSDPSARCSTSSFIDRGQCFEVVSKQGGAGWLRIRELLVVTASQFAQAAGLSKYHDRTVESLLNEKLGIEKKIFKPFTQIIMEHGTNMEPYVRDFYEKKFHKKVKELGVVIPKFCLDIGVSVDGYVEETNSIIEIKCPVSMYSEIIEYVYRKKLGEKFPPFYHDHIPIDHYCQMQGGMAILGAPYCDYIVCSTRQGKYYITRVLRNPDFWNHILFPKLLQFIEKVKAMKKENFDALLLKEREEKKKMDESTQTVTQPTSNVEISEHNPVQNLN